MTTRRNPWGSLFLIVAAVGFLGSVFQPWWQGWLADAFRAFFEASLIGALADWFAVTALFRRPLGLPLPHTDLLVRKKEHFVRALPRFLGSFLEKERLDPVLRSVDWVSFVLDYVSPSDLDDWMKSLVQPWINLGSSPPTLWEQQAVRWTAAVLYRELETHREALVGPVTDLIKKSAGWKGFFVSRDTVDEVVSGVLTEVAAVRDRSDHPFRLPLVAALRQAVPRWLEEGRPSVWTKTFLDRVRIDEDFRTQTNAKIADFIVTLWTEMDVSTLLTSGFGYLLAQTDARTLADQIEEAVWNDLQYIRVNGALVGGLAGLFLQIVVTMLHRLSL